MNWLQFIPLILWQSLAGAQVNTPSCNSACINYLTALTNEKNIVNSAVWDYSGPVSASQIDTVCTLAQPLSCCGCGGIGLDDKEQVVLIAWTLTCNTFNAVQDGGASAVTCWTSHFQNGCVDYNGLLEAGNCATPSSMTDTSPTFSSTMSSVRMETTQNTPSATSSSSGSAASSNSGTGTSGTTPNSGSSLVSQFYDLSGRVTVVLVMYAQAFWFFG